MGQAALHGLDVEPRGDMVPNARPAVERRPAQGTPASNALRAAGRGVRAPFRDLWAIGQLQASVQPKVSGAARRQKLDPGWRRNSSSSELLLRPSAWLRCG